MLRDEIKQYVQQFLEESNNVLYFLFSIREGISHHINLSEEVLFRLMKDKVLNRDYINDRLELLVPFYETDDGSPLTASSQINEVIAEVNARIDEYRSMFRVIRPGNMGERKSCVDKMIRFILENNSSFDEVILATNNYFQLTDPTYIMSAENFMYKIGTDGKEVSKLALTLDDIRVGALVGNQTLLN